MKTTLPLTALFTLFTAASTANAAILIDYDDGTPGDGHDASVLSGDFTGLTDASFSPWVSLSTGSPQFRTNNASGIGSNTNYVATLDRVIGIDTAYVVQAGDEFNLSFMWRDAAFWDSDDTMQLELFVTDTNLIGGNTVDSIVLDSGGPDGVGTWETESESDLSFANALAVGKTLFVRVNAISAQGEFSRYDNVFVEVVPEPSSLALIGLGGVCFLRRRRA